MLTRRSFLLLFTLAVLTTEHGTLNTLHAAAPKPPNILVIVADDLGYADVGFQGCKDIPTPHLDALAKRSVRCTSGYVTHPFCSPTRAGLLTGRYQQRFGHEFNPGPPTAANVEVGLPLSERTLADVLRGAGYRTALVGKWHLGNIAEFGPNRHGFDEFFGINGSSADYFTHGNTSGRLYFQWLVRLHKQFRANV